MLFESLVDCCMSGCVNCVWIMYVNELKKYYEKDGNECVKREIDRDFLLFLWM